MLQRIVLPYISLSFILSNAAAQSSALSNSTNLQISMSAYRQLTWGGGGGNLKKSKSNSGILGWVLTFFDPNFKLPSEVFRFNWVTIVWKISYTTMCLPPMHLKTVL